jgi:hypothetical protein
MIYLMGHSLTPRKLIVVVVISTVSLLVQLSYKIEVSVFELYHHIMITQTNCISLRCAYLYVTVSFKEDERQVSVPWAGLINCHG